MSDLTSRLTRARRRLSTLGIAGLIAAAIAAYVVAVVFIAYTRPGGSGESAGQNPAPSASKALTSAPRFPASDYRQSQFPRLDGRPLIGVNYTHQAFQNCNFHRTYLLASYHEPGVAERVHDQLLQMRRAGVATIRTVIWHLTDASGLNWGPIPSAGGELRQPYRTNLIRFLRELRKFGFARFTVGFNPREANNPLLVKYRPSKFAENWRFIRAVRSLVKRYGPASTRVDLFSEGAPNEAPTAYEPLPRQTGRYLSRLYRLYVSRYGNRDVSVSAIGSEDPARLTNRLENLINILKSSGQPLPRWYDVHIGYDPAGASHALRQAEAVLDRYGQRQPLVIGDLGYDNSRIAAVIERFIRDTDRPVEEISPWWTHTRHGCPVPPPYSPGAYGALRDR